MQCTLSLCNFTFFEKNFKYISLNYYCSICSWFSFFFGFSIICILSSLPLFNICHFLKSFGFLPFEFKIFAFSLASLQALSIVFIHSYVPPSLVFSSEIFFFHFYFFPEFHHFISNADLCCYAFYHFHNFYLILKYK